jgi:hypothetical protein
LADEGGVSFWVPGFFGSLSAAPQQPGWSLANIYYHTSVSAGADVARAREFTLGRVPTNVTVNANLNLNVNATGDLGFVIPTYVFATPVLGGQASASLVAAYGVVSTTLAGQLAGNITGPGGGSVPFMRSDSISDTTWGFGDLVPQFALRWNAGVNNYMTYITGDQSQGLRRIWRLGSAHRLEHMADICHLTRGSASTRHEPDDYEIAAERTVASSMSELGPPPDSCIAVIASYSITSSAIASTPGGSQRAPA